MNAALIAHALGGRKASVGWMARCLAHDEQTPNGAEKAPIEARRRHRSCTIVALLTELVAHFGPLGNPIQHFQYVHRNQQNQTAYFFGCLWRTAVDPTKRSQRRGGPYG